MAQPVPDEPDLEREMLRAEVTQLREAVQSRTVIGQATGMLMERYKMLADGAWRVLVRVSQARNIKIRELAERMTADPDSADAYPEKWPPPLKRLPPD